MKGVFRKSCESSLDVLRSHRESLMSVLETFVYDPLCEWSSKSHHISGDSENEMAVKTLKTIEGKLKGYTQSSQKFGFPLSTQGQVSELISQATSLENLCRMYIGWAPFM